MHEQGGNHGCNFVVAFGHRTGLRAVAEAGALSEGFGALALAVPAANAVVLDSTDIAIGVPNASEPHRCLSCRGGVYIAIL